jgi:hypothetical protein
MKVLLLDTNVSSYPIYEHLIKNYEVFVAGSNPEDCLALCCPNYIKIDYSSLGQVEQVVDSYKIDFVLPGCNDVSFKTACLYSWKHKKDLNIDSPEINEVINVKDKFKSFALAHGLKVPKQIQLNEIEDLKISKIIVKPVDSFSGKGVTVVSRENFFKINDAIQEAISNSKNQQYLIEEYVEGQLYSHSAFISKGKIIQDFIVEEHCITNPFAVDTSWLIPNDNFSNLSKIRIEILKLVAKLNLCDGLIHTQFIDTGDDIRILEITRRCPGDLYSKLIETSSSFEYSRYYIDTILKKESLVKLLGKIKNILRHTIYQSKSDIFISVKYESRGNLMEFFPHYKSGKKIDTISSTRVGILFIEFNEYDEIIQTKKLINKRKFSII